MNSTNFSSYSIQTLLVQSAYIVVGFSAFSVNCLVLAAVLVKKNFSEHFFYFAAALAFGDMAHGLGYFFAGIRRLDLILMQSDAKLVTLWECAIAYPTIFFTYGRQASIVLTLLISIDRFLALSTIKIYMNLGRWYVIGSISSAYFGVTSFIIIICYTSYLAGPDVKVSIMCYTDFTPTSTAYEALSVIVLGFCSSFLMSTALVVLRFQRSSSITQIQRIQLKRQSKLTTIIAFIVLSTLMLWTIPNTIAYLYSTNGSPLFLLLSPYMWCLSVFSSTINAIIFICKNPELNKVLLKIMTRSNQVSTVGTM